MNWNVFEYAGPTALAVCAFACACGVAAALAGVETWLVARRRWRWAVFPAPLVLAWLALAAWAGPKLDHAWLYLQENALRTYGTYARLTFATAFLPTFETKGRGAFMHLATRDLGFAKGRPVTEERVDGARVARYADEDYPGGVTTLDGRAVHTGARFAATRRMPALVALFLMPGAKRARVTGRERAFYREPFETAGLTVLPEGSAEKADIALVAPVPDWMAGSDFPAAGDWRRVAAGLVSGGVAALHLDARLLSRARLKGILADFRAVFGRYTLWCAGRHDYVVVSPGAVLADEALELFAEEKTFAAFAEAGCLTPADVFASYVGTDNEVEPGLVPIPAQGHAGALWTAPRLAFARAPTNHLAAVRAADVTPYAIPFPAWFRRGVAAAPVYADVTNGIFAVQAARREFLVGFDHADSGVSTNALARWARAAEVNPRDPLLRALADSLDLEGRRYLRIGNANGAIRCYENRLSILTNDVAAVHNFGVCLKKSGHPDMAARVFARAVQMDPLTDEHRLELVETCAASAHEDIACRQLDVLMKRHPKEPGLRLRAAKLLCKASNPARDNDRAVKLAEEAVEMTGWKDRAFVLGLADVYIESGRVLMGAGLKKRMREMKFER